MSAPRGESMSLVDSAWLHMDSPANLMMVTGVLVLDGRLDLPRLRSLIEQRLLRFNRFRQRVAGAAHPWRNPRWEPDPEFDLDRHLVRETLSPPGDAKALQDRVGELMSVPLDPAHPLWQMHLIEEYGGGSALITRLHHCIGDGMALVYALLSLTDETPEGAPDKEFPVDDDDAECDPERVGRRVGRSVGQAINAGSDLLARAGATTAALGKLTLMASDSPTAFKGTLAAEKRAVWSRPLDLERVKQVRRKMGATVNDLLLAAVSGALRRYLLGRGENVDGADIRAVVPVNLRPPEEAHRLGNRFGLVFLQLPLSVEDSLDRVFEVKKRMDAIKETPEALVAYQILKAMGMAPRLIYEQILGVFGTKATAVMTNVRGPGVAIYLAGVKVREVMAWVPRSAGLGLGVSILSYDGKVWLGVASDAGLVPDPERILEAFHEEFDALAELASLPE